MTARGTKFDGSECKSVDGAPSGRSGWCSQHVTAWSRKVRCCMRIRAATIADLAQVIACEDLAFPRFIPHSRRCLKPRSNLEPQIREGAVHVISIPTRILAYISFSANPDHLFVDAIGVLPELQGRGLGSQLLAFAERVALRLRLRSLKLFTDGSTANNRFYQCRGYRETDRCDDGSFTRVFYMKHVGPRASPASLRNRES